MKNTFLIILTLGMLSGCVTQKSRNEQSKIGQYYHNLNSRFNGWFNANELVDLSIVTLEEQHQDNYNEILPLYEYSAVDNADAVKADLDEAIKKVSVVVTIHKYSDWVDDCYLLIGKSLYLKKDYEAAENAFEFYMDEFLPTGKRSSVKFKKKATTAQHSGKSSSEVKEANKRKKELQKARKKAEKERKKYNKELRNRKKKGLPTDDLVRPGTTKAADGTTTIPTSEVKKYEPTAAELKEKARAEGEQANFFLRASAYDEAILWLAKTYIERENWTSADYQLRRLEGDDILPPRVYEELPVARAYYHLQRENYPQVYPFLEQAIERARDVTHKARYSYIIAQLYFRDGNVEKAKEYYQEALDYSNQYEMIFNTQLSIIRSSVKDGSLSNEQAQAQLDKMIKDIKNEPFLGRIYYLKGTLAIDANDIPLAIGNLESSVQFVGDDAFQAIESQYLLATLYMQQLMYVEAEQAYKDCAAIMKTTDPRYKNVKKLADNLTDIALNLNTIKLQDSLLYLSSLSEQQLKTIAVEIKIKKQKEAELAASNSKIQGPGAADKKSLPANPAASPGLPQARPVSDNASAEGVFWAFDQKNIKKTRREFDKVWGDIPLTDFWRVSSKASQYASTAEADAANQEGAVGIYESEIEDFLKDVPKTDSARAISHGKIRKSMLLLGQLYRDRLDDFKSSISVLESLLEKYPGAPEELETYYQLYLSALSAGDHAKAEKYKQLIISKYPNSRFAKVLSDPNFAASQLSEQERLMQYYDETFLTFEKGDYNEALNRIRDVDEKFGVNNLLMSKFDLLKAMCMGATVGKEAYVDGLKHVIARYPNTDEEKKAKDMLLLLGEGNAGKSYGEAGLESANFTMEENALHFAVVYVTNQDQVTLTDTKIAIAEFNKKFFQLDNLKMASLVFDPSKNHSLVLVRSFNTKEKAMKYYETAIRNPKDFLPANALYEVYPITQKNYREVIKARSLEAYKTFFEANY